jgi:hypothetical protein
MRTRAPATAKRLASGCLIAPRGAPGYNEVTLCYDDNAASEIDAAAILTEGRCEYKMQKQTHFSAVPRSGPEALRRTSEGTIRKCEIEKTNPLYPRNCWVFTEEGGAPAAAAKRDRLSSVRHAAFHADGASEFAVLGTPASFSRKRERKKGRIREVQNNPTSRQCREVVLSVFAKDLDGQADGS